MESAQLLSLLSFLPCAAFAYALKSYLSWQSSMLSLLTSYSISWRFLCACYRPQTKSSKVMFSQVSVCPRGDVCPIACLDTHPPGTPEPDTPSPQGPEADPPDQRQTPLSPQEPEADTPLCRHPRARGRHPLCSACWDTINKRAVRVPLECILVF